MNSPQDKPIKNAEISENLNFKIFVNAEKKFSALKIERITKIGFPLVQT